MKKNVKSNLVGASLFFFLFLPVRSVDDVKVVRAGGTRKSTKRLFYDAKRLGEMLKPLSRLRSMRFRI